MSTETTQDPIAVVQAVQAELPCRQAMVVLDTPTQGARLSRSRHDRPARDGAVVTHPEGWGIAEGGHKENRDGEWWNVVTIRPPQTDAERLTIARAMARDWDRITHDVLKGEADDDRDRGRRQAERQQRRELRERLVAAGLLD